MIFREGSLGGAQKGGHVEEISDRDRASRGGSDNTHISCQLHDGRSAGRLAGAGHPAMTQVACRGDSWREQLTDQPIRLDISRQPYSEFPGIQPGSCYEPSMLT